MAAKNKSTVLITGGSGLIGRALIPQLTGAGFSVRILSRRGKALEGAQSYRWDIDKGYIEEGAVEDVDHIIHLAGENIGDGRWSESRKKSIISSRVDSARLLFDAVEKRNPDLNSFTSASATGYYGAVTSDHVFTEDDPPAGDFAARVCVKWEEAAGLFRAGGYRTSIIRTGIVLSKEGGMLARVLPTINIHFSPLFGRGHHYLPWIHIDDLCGIYIRIVKDDNMDGIFNAVSPLPVKYREFIIALSSAKEKKIFAPPTPSLPWRILFGEKASILLEGSRVSADRILNTGYEFTYPDLKQALNSLLSR